MWLMNNRIDSNQIELNNQNLNLNQIESNKFKYIRDFFFVFELVRTDLLGALAVDMPQYIENKRNNGKTQKILVNDKSVTSGMFWDI